MSRKQSRLPKKQWDRTSLREALARISNSGPAMVPPEAKSAFIRTSTAPVLELPPAPRLSKPHPRQIAEAERRFVSEVQAKKLIDTARAFLHDYATRLTRVRELRVSNEARWKKIQDKNSDIVTQTDVYANFVIKNARAHLLEAARALHVIAQMPETEPREGYLAQYGAWTLARIHDCNEKYSRFLNEAQHREEILEVAFAHLSERLKTFGRHTKTDNLCE